MYTQVQSKVVVEFDDSVVSQAVAMAGGNAVAVEATVFHFNYTGGTSPKLQVKVEGSNDLQNWSNLSTAAPEIAEFDGEGDGEAQVTGIAFGYVRLRLASTGSPTAGNAIAAAGINVASL